MSEKVTFKELIEAIAEETNNSKQFTHDFLKDFVDVINSGLEDDGNVNIAGLGKFELRHVDEREGYNPQTEEKMTIPAHNRVIFKPYKNLRELVNVPYAHMEPELIEKEDTADQEKSSGTEEDDFIPTAPPTSQQTDSGGAADADAVSDDEQPPFDLEGTAETSSKFSFEDNSDLEEAGNESDDDETLNDDFDDVVGTEDTEAEPATASSEENSPYAPDYQSETDQEAGQETDEQEEEEVTSSTPSFDEHKPAEKDNSPLPVIAAAAVILILALSGAWYFGLFSSENNQEQTASNQAVATADMSTSSATSETDNQTGDQAQEQETNDTQNQPKQTAQVDQPQQQAAQADKAQQKVRESLELTIAKGQTLWSIAHNQYNKSKLWPWIYDKNESLENPNIIHAGRKLTVPLPSMPQSVLSSRDSVDVAKGYISTYLWYKNNGYDNAKNYLWVAKQYHKDINSIADVQIDKEDLTFANQAR